MADDWKLPAGWFVAHAEDGEAYFYNETTGETSWDPPAGSFPKVAPAGAGASDQAAAAQDDSDDDWDVDDDDDDDDDEQQQGTPQGRARHESAFDAATRFGNQCRTGIQQWCQVVSVGAKM